MSIDLITRAEWDARAPKGAYEYLGSTKGVKVHYTGGRVDPAIVDDHRKCGALVRSFQAQHMDGNGWLDLGYSMVACPHRKVFVGRGLHHLPAANGAGLNSGHYAVLALVGNSGLTVPSDEQLLGILDAIAYLRDKGNAGKEIKGHRDGYATDCPGPKLYAWVKAGAPRPGGSSSAPSAPKPSTPHAPASDWTKELIMSLPTLSEGSKGAFVGRLQGLLCSAGFPVAIDEDFGPKTKAAVIKAQKKGGKAADGVPGPITWTYLLTGK